MNFNPVVLAIPMYFILIIGELIFEQVTKKLTYRVNDAVTNISLGILSQVSGVFLKLLSIGVYIVIYEKIAFFNIEPTWASFVALIILQDLCYYWSHRMSHEISLFWGGHVVHHQSEDFNLSVALRQSSTSTLWSFMFYLPLAFLGFDPMQFVIVNGINLLYQFWIHTEHINKLGWLEYIFNTPSHHRVHHGRDPKYIDKNYAGMLIIWDRMFGTFKEEEERPVYGITKPLKSWNPVYANFSHYIDLFKAVKKSRSVKDAMGILFQKPGWMPEHLGGYQKPHQVESGYQKFDVLPALPVNLYIIFQFVVLIGLTALFLFNLDKMPVFFKAGYAVWIVASTLIFGWLFEMKTTGFYLEIARLLMIPVLLFFIIKNGVVATFWPLVIGVVIVLTSLGILYFYGRKYQRRAIS